MAERSLLLNEKVIRTRNIFHAAILLNCGAQLVDIVEVEDRAGLCEIILGLSLLDKRTAARKFQELSDDFSGTPRKRPLRAILENSILSDIEATFFKLRRQLRSVSQREVEDEGDEQ
tara:strand:- start:3545 stop:3895 length:351 start_codon:yes stop_codon:yes gene_type:complete